MYVKNLIDYKITLKHHKILPIVDNSKIYCDKVVYYMEGGATQFY